MSQKRKKMLIIGFLLILSLVLTTGTFAFWATNIEGNSSESMHCYEKEITIVRKSHTNNF